MKSADFGRLIAKAWSDNGFSSRLQESPESALSECGITPPTGVKVFVHANSPSELHLVIPEARRMHNDDEDGFEGGGSPSCWLKCRGNNSW